MVRVESYYVSEGNVIEKENTMWVCREMETTSAYLPLMDTGTGHMSQSPPSFHLTDHR